MEALEKNSLDHLLSLSQSANAGVKCFSGPATCMNTFDWNAVFKTVNAESEIWLWPNRMIGDAALPEAEWFAWTLTPMPGNLAVVGAVDEGVCGFRPDHTVGHGRFTKSTSRLALREKSVKLTTLAPFNFSYSVDEIASVALPNQGERVVFIGFAFSSGYAGARRGQYG